MKTKDLTTRRGKSAEDLMKEIRELEGRKEALQFDLAAGKVKNIREIRDVKKSVAQLKTLLRERETARS
ncbi:MAG: 50S ribosomal protein L29 [Candidatus Jorgensenbacteria bacterium]|nr:50S ribosomal protein L29 [Candidatus Jorgensenbacteria bacterium]